MAKRYPIDLKLSGVGGAAGTVTLRTQAFKAGGLLCVQRVAVRSLDRDEALCNVAFERAGEKLYIASITTVVEGLAEGVEGPTYAPSDYGVAFDFSDLSSGDRVEAYVFGYWTEAPG